MAMNRAEAERRARGLADELPLSCDSCYSCCKRITDALERVARETAASIICAALGNADECRENRNWAGQAALMKLVDEIRAAFGMGII